MEENRKSSLTRKDKIRVGIVNYLNTKPLLYGLTCNDIKDDMVLHGDYPSRLAEMLRDDEIDIGLIPVAAIPELPVSFIVGDYCIATEGEIASVALFSEVPMNEITKVYLDYQSKSSVALLKYLMHESWGIHPELVYASDESYRELIKGPVAGLVIGDRAFEQRKISTFIYDLGSEWRAISGLPFVFAAWVSNKKLPDDFIVRFNEANALGLEHINEIVSETSFSLYDLQKYYKIHLSYQLDERKKRGMSRFLELISNQVVSKFEEASGEDIH